jgi:hypothetical protein
VVAVAEVHAVEVSLEDLRLGEPPLEHEGDHQLAPLAPERTRPVVEYGPRELLRDAAGALDDAAGADVAPRGACDRQRIDPVMRMEPAVLGREHGLHRHRGDRVERHGPALFVRQREGGLARAVQHERPLPLGRDVHVPGEGAQTCAELPRRDGAAHRDQKDNEDGGEQQAAGHAAWRGHCSVRGA